MKLLLKFGAIVQIFFWNRKPLDFKTLQSLGLQKLLFPLIRCPLSIILIRIKEIFLIVVWFKNFLTFHIRSAMVKYRNSEGFRISSGFFIWIIPTKILNKIKGISPFSFNLRRLRRGNLNKRWSEAESFSIFENHV